MIVLGTARCEVVRWADVDEDGKDALLIQYRESLNCVRLMQRVQDLTAGFSLSRSALRTFKGRFGKCLVSASVRDRKAYQHLRAFMQQRH
jgi:hypothetical protein